jgi:hypothetical protein
MGSFVTIKSDHDNTKGGMRRFGGLQRTFQKPASFRRCLGSGEDQAAGGW